MSLHYTLKSRGPSVKGKDLVISEVVMEFGVSVISFIRALLSSVKNKDFPCG